jgi:hypothetical protein
MYTWEVLETTVARMIRKQIYLESKQEKKLQRLAHRWGCSEAEVLRKAIDRIPDAEGEFLERLEAAGLLAPPPDDEDLDESESLEEMERAYEEYLQSRSEPIGLLDAVLEDRQR